MIADCHSRFTAASFLRNMLSDTIAEYLISNRRQRMGIPVKILRDAWANFPGPRWDAISTIYGITITQSTIGSSYHLGEAEGHIQILKKTYSSTAWYMEKNFDRRTILSLAVMSRYIAPNSTTKIASITILTGRDDFIEMCRLSSSDSLGDKEKLTSDYWSMWESIKHAQSEIIRRDADNVVKSCIRKT